MKYYNNPISPSTKPDPYILQYNGEYYCYSTHRDGVKVSYSKDLVHFEDKGFAYSLESEKDFWAPAVVYINGIFYLYFSSVKKTDKDTLEEMLKVATSHSPLGPFTFEKQFFDYFSIDAHPYFYRGDLYLFYSTNILGCDENMPGTSILVDKMKSPLQFEGKPKVVVPPTLEDEVYEKNRFLDNRDWHTIEGASIIERNNKMYILYSANSYLNENYFINYSVGDLEDDIRDINFVKYPNDYEYHALMRKNNLVSGTGHNSVCKGPDLIEDFIVYHGRNNDIPLDHNIEQRTMRIDRLTFEGNKLICDGPNLNKIKIPKQPIVKESNLILNNDKKTIKTKGNYVFDLWLQGNPSHSGIRYGFNIGKNLQFELLQGLNTINVYKINGNIKRKIQKIELTDNYNHTVSHLFKVTKVYNSISLLLEDGRIFNFNDSVENDVEIFSLFSQIKIVYFALNSFNTLEGNNLLYLENFLDFNKTLYVWNNKIDIKRETEIRFKKEGTHSLTIEPMSNLAIIKDGENHISVKENMDIVFNYKKESSLLLFCNQIRIVKYNYTKICND